MKKKESTDNGSVIRSVKMRNLLEELPPGVIRWGTVVIIAIFILILLVVLLLPYPYSTGESIYKHILG